jgi:hypothetical protein
MVESGKLRGKPEIGVRVGRVVNKYKVAKHFELTIEDGHFVFAVRKEQVEAEAALDGLYIIRTNVPKKQMSADACTGPWRTPFRPHDGQCSGGMADTVPAGWRTVRRSGRNAVRHGSGTLSVMSPE